jgi:hypothetical protein
VINQHPLQNFEVLSLEPNQGLQFLNVNDTVFPNALPTLANGLFPKFCFFKAYGGTNRNRIQIAIGVAQTSTSRGIGLCRYTKGIILDTHGAETWGYREFGDGTMHVSVYPLADF